MSKTHSRHVFLDDVVVEGKLTASELILPNRTAGVLSVKSNGELTSTNEQLTGLGTRVTTDPYESHTFLIKEETGTDGVHYLKEITAGKGLSVSTTTDGDGVLIEAPSAEDTSLFNVLSSDTGGRDYWYDETPNGVITQGGTLELPSDADGIDVTFPRPFTEKVWHIHLQNICSGNTGWKSVIAGSRDTGDPEYNINPSVNGFRLVKDDKGYDVPDGDNDPYSYITWKAVGR